MFRLIFKSALNSLLQRKSRSIMVILMIVLSLWGLMFMQGIYDGMIKQMIDNALRSDCGEISLYAKDFRASKDIKKYIKDEEALEDFFNSRDDIKSYTRRIQTQGLAATARYSKNIFIYAVDREQEIKQSRLNEYIKEGSFDFGSKSQGVIVGFKLAKKLKIKLGKKLILTTQDINNEIVSIKLNVTGIIKTNNMAFDENAVFMDLKRGKKFLNLDGMNHIAIRVNGKSDIAGLKKDLKKNFPNLESYSWDEIYPALLQSKKMMEVFALVSYLIVFLTAAAGIFAVVLISVLERLREFGILRAVGTRFHIIAYMIFCESLIIGVAGFVLGSLTGFLTLYYFNIYGLDLSSFSDALDEFGMDAVTYAVIRLEYFITGFIAVFSAIILSILIPLRILKRSNPVEVING